MAGLASQLTQGQVTEFVNRSGRFGLTIELFNKLLSEDDTHERWVRSLIERPPEQPLVTAPVGTVFTPPEEQVLLVRKWNEERGWGFMAEEFKKLFPAPSPYGRPLVTVVLVPYLPDLPMKGKKKGGVPGYLRTFQELWGVAASGQERSWRCTATTTPVRRRSSSSMGSNIPLASAGR
jgi:hypothetical protein